MSDDSPQGPDDPRRDGDARADDDPGVEGTAGEGAEPTRFRVADTGWPPAAAPAGSALPRRTPGASGAPGSVPASDDDPSGAPEDEGGPVAAVTSPPLDEEPWARLPPASGPEQPPAAVEAPMVAEPGEAAPVAPPAQSPDEPAPGTDGEPRSAADPAGEQAPAPDLPEREPAPAPGAEGGPAPTADAVAGAEDTTARSSGRHRSPRSRRSRDARPARGHGTRARSRGPHRPETGWPVVRLVLLALAVVAAIVFGVLTIVTRVWPGPPANPYTSASTRAAVAAASAVAGPILSYDYQTIDRKAAQLAPLQTATCASQYARLITTTVKPLAVQNKATQKATVLAAGVSSATASHVTVLAFMQLTSTNSVKPGKEINEAQLSVSMVHQHGRWLLAGTSANGSGAGTNPSCGGASATGK